jgi:hypothetical protein
MYRSITRSPIEVSNKTAMMGGWKLGLGLGEIRWVCGFWIIDFSALKEVPKVALESIPGKKC